jgi:fatty-acid peroxygenase
MGFAGLAAGIVMDEPLAPHRFASFGDFWRHYLLEHRSPLNRSLHLLGTGAALTLIAYALRRRRYRLLLLAPLVGYLPAWFGHFLVERNRPATFGNPLWSLRADLRMMRLAATGRLDAEVKRLSAPAPAANPIPRDGMFDSTLALRADPYRYISRRCRALTTDVFQTRLMLRPTIFLCGRDAAELFYDQSRFIRHGATPPRIQNVLFGRGGVQTLDDQAHRHRKQMLMRLMDPERVAELADTTRRYWRIYARRWIEHDRVVLYDEAREIICRAVCEWAGVPLEASDVAHRTRELSSLFDNAGSAGPAHWWGRFNRFRTNHWAAGLIDDFRRGRLPAAPDSALAIIASHRTLSGELLPLPTAAVELLNVLRPTVAVAVFVTFVAHALHAHPHEAARLSDAPHDSARAEQFLQEIRRFYPFFPAVAGKVRRDFAWRGYHFPQGMRAMLDLYGTDHDPQQWQDPHRFRPHRFDGRWPGPFGFIPQGGGDPHIHHRCPGEPITLALMHVALEFLTRDIAYDLPPQDLSIDFTRLPALPTSHVILSNIRLRRPAAVLG